jgi:hypothetical protein
MGLRGFDQHMIGVVHKTIGMAEPFASGYEHGEDREEILSVPVVQEEGASFIAQRGYMIICPEELYSQRSGYMKRTPNQMLYWKT